MSLSSGYFNHCSSICHFADGYFVAHYAGLNECSEDQSVFLTFVRHRTAIDTIKIGSGTGNPVIWNEQDAIVMLYSRFEDSNTIKCLVDRWKYCSLWVQKFSFMHNKIYWSSLPVKLSDASQHLLGRCRPVNFDGHLVLPLYDEVNRSNVLYQVDLFPSFKPLATYGHQMIQPTLWSSGGMLHSLSRNFNQTVQFAHYNQSADGSRWSDSKESSIYNTNNSCHAFTFNSINYLIWNDHPSYDRRNLSIGIINDDLTITKVAVLDKKYGSYPSVSTKDDEAIISYTTSARTIAVRRFTSDELTSPESK